MSFIRENIDYKKCFNEYLQNGIVTINNIFHDDFAEDIYKHIIGLEEHEWDAAFPSPPGKEEENSTTIKRINENYKKIESRQQENLKKLNNDEFTYRFDRLNVNHTPGCTCIICSLRETFLKSGHMFSVVSKITGRYDLNHKFTSFISRYRSNDYLTLHTDTTGSGELKRHVAIIFHLAKDWKPWYGGNLIITDQDENVVELFTPKFNTLTIMNVEDKKMPHFVSEIANGLDKNRYAISYWM